MKKRKKNDNRGRLLLVALVVALLTGVGSGLYLRQQTPEIKYDLKNAYRWEVYDGEGRLKSVDGDECKNNGGKYYLVQSTQDGLARGFCYKTTDGEYLAMFSLLGGSVLVILFSGMLIQRRIAAVNS
jgi:hypothetical protein